MDAIAAKQDPRVASTLALIDGTGRRLLALRSYLRSGGRRIERWSWDEQQIAAYEQSPEYRELQAEIGRVRQAFGQANPGYDLWVNPQVRSLDIQIEHWNTNESVAEAAANLLAATRELVTSTGFPASGTEAVLPVEFAQTEIGAVTVASGNGLTVTLLLPVAEQPAAVVTVTPSCTGQKRLPHRTVPGNISGNRPSNPVDGGSVCEAGR